jgi:aryl-alcohol dehydrogenase-like predicted oxidoreductase
VGTIKVTEPADLRKLASETDMLLEEVLEWFDRHFENGYIGYVRLCDNSPEKVAAFFDRMYGELN